MRTPTFSIGGHSVRWRYERPAQSGTGRGSGESDPRAVGLSEEPMQVVASFSVRNCENQRGPRLVRVDLLLCATGSAYRRSQQLFQRPRDARNWPSTCAFFTEVRPLPLEVIREVKERFGVQISEGYRLTESSPAVLFASPHDEYREGSVGKPVWGAQVRIVEDSGVDVPMGAVGQLIVRGHMVMKGYFRRPEATAETVRDGRLYTGDPARRDAWGYYCIVDRLKEIIPRGGYNVYPPGRSRRSS